MSKQPRGRVLLVDDDRPSRESISDWLTDDGFEVIAVADGKEATPRIHDGIEVIVTDLKMPRTDGLELLRIARDKAPHAAVIVVTAYGDVETAVDALKGGAFDYLTKPINPQHLSHRIEQALEKQSMARDIAQLHAELQERKGVGAMVGSCPAMREVFEKVRLVSDTNSTVLIVGESGTGKELVARAVHDLSHRGGGPFLPINCAAISESLIESELFGHEKGAFTGATERKEGFFQAASGGTLFIDEIGEMNVGLQSKLLRALESRTVLPVGSTREIDVDVRVVAATNRDLEARVKSGEFREDLFYRLRVVELRLPPLRERVGDVPLLVRKFIDEIAEYNNRSVRDITPDAMEAIEPYSWPGNVRELRNTLESVIVLSLKDVIDRCDLPPNISGAQPATSMVRTGRTLEEMERDAIRRTLEENEGRRQQTADMLGISVRTLQRKVNEYGLD